jgi:hypothetical protein
MPTGGTIHVVATLNVTQRSGELRHVLPVTAVPPGQAPLAAGRPRRSSRAARGPQVALRVFGRGDALIGEFPATFIADACRDPGDDVTGSIDAFIAGASSATRLDLLLDGTVVDTFIPGAAPGAVANIRGSTPAGGPRRGAARARRTGGAAPDADADPIVTWTPAPAPRAGARKAPRAGGTAAAPAADTQYTVQVSVDGGATWQTVGFALKTPQVRIDRGVLGDADTVKVRVTATSGFTSTTTEKTLKASELG